MRGAAERIVVALDAVSENRMAIRAAARLAARWGVHLHGVFVEDDDLIRLANLPFARQVTLGIGVEALDRLRAQRQMRVFIERARHDLAAAAKQHGIEWSFEVVHGAAASGDLGSSSGDFIVACTATRPIGGHFHVECRWWTPESRTPATRLLTRHQGDLHAAVAAVLHGRGAASGRLLEAASRLAEANDARLIVICAPLLAQTTEFKAWLDRQLAGRTVEVDIQLMSEPTALHRLIVELRCRLVALEASADEARPERLREMVTKIACDVLLVG